MLATIALGRFRRRRSFSHWRQESRASSGCANGSASALFVVKGTVGATFCDHGSAGIRGKGSSSACSSRRGIGRGIERLGLGKGQIGKIRGNPRRTGDCTGAGGAIGPGAGRAGRGKIGPGELGTVGAGTGSCGGCGIGVTGGRLGRTRGTGCPRRCGSGSGTRGPVGSKGRCGYVAGSGIGSRGSGIGGGGLAGRRRGRDGRRGTGAVRRGDLGIGIGYSGRS